MMKNILKIFFVSATLLLMGNLLVNNIRKIPYEVNLAKVLPVPLFDAESKTILEGLSLEQKIGQMFIIGFEGEKVNSEIENLIKKLHPGGILLLKRNIEDENQLKNLIDSLQKIAIEDSGLPLFVAVDQEGGLVSRIEWIKNTPQYQIKNTKEAYQIGQERGKKLKELGINLNLAPLLDSALFQDFIFERSFQKDVATTGELAENLIAGQKNSGILTAFKHFPGYGGIPFNPEERLAVLEITPEISQFQKAAESRPEMIMVSNVVYKNLDRNLPFSLSEKGIGFLKDKIGGDHIIISDDLAQNSLLYRFPLKEIVTLPVKAGVDILIFSGWRTPAEGGVLALQDALKNGEISEKRINNSVLKIIELKQKLIE